MKNRNIAVTLLLALLFLGFSCGALLVKSQPSSIPLNINVSSPIENGTYANNTVQVSFTYDTKAIPSSFIIQEVVFACVLDGQPNSYNGHVTRLGDYLSPIPLSLTSSLDVPEGNHTLYVEVTVWGKDYTYDIYENSTVINFTIVNSTVSIPTPNQSTSLSPSPSPTVPELSWLVIVPLLLSIFSVAVILRHRKTASTPKA